MIGLDTAAVVDLFKGNKEIQEIISSQSEMIVTNEIVYLELMYGLNPKNKKHQEEEIYYDQFFDTTLNLTLTASACKQARVISWQLREKGKTIEPFDCAIAGIYLVNGVTKIITRNAKHFEHIPGLKVISY